MEFVKSIFEASPIIALFLCIAVGFAIGRIKIGKFQLGGIVGTLFAAIIIGQIILIVPIITTFTISAVSRIDDRYRKAALTLGANLMQTARIIIREARFAIMAAIVMAFGRVIAEVGISMMLGGNAKGFTRTMTTAMALEYDKGEFVLSVALGTVLLCVSFGVNIFGNYFQGKSRL